MNLFRIDALKQRKNKNQPVRNHREWEHEHFQALVVADCHGSLTPEELSAFLDDRVPNVVFLLGDNFEDDLEIVKRNFQGKETDIFGIEGNHDFHGTLQEHGIANLHCRAIEWNGIKIGGFSGSIRYKEDSRYVMYTNKESENLIRNLPECDILLTHDFPCFRKTKTITPHSGLTGIADYIRKNKPFINLHGHLHERHSEIIPGTLTQIRCCYRLEFLAF